MIDFNKIRENNVVVELLKKREELDDAIFDLDKMALLNYELAKLKEK